MAYKDAVKSCYKIAGVFSCPWCGRPAQDGAQPSPGNNIYWCWYEKCLKQYRLFNPAWKERPKRAPRNPGYDDRDQYGYEYDY